MKLTRQERSDLRNAILCATDFEFAWIDAYGDAESHGFLDAKLRKSLDQVEAKIARWERLDKRLAKKKGLHDG